MLNKVCLCGRLATGVEMRTLDSGTNVAKVCIAVQRNYKNNKDEYDADFFNCTAWRGTADILFKYFKKGDFIVVGGHLQVDKWDDNGTTRSAVKVIIDNVTFTGSKNNGQSKQQVQSDPTNFDDLTSVPIESDLPF